MTYSYFPGCTLKTKGKALDHWGRLSAQALGFPLEELPEWQCCGGVYPMAKDEIATRLSSVRALSNAKDGKLVTLCSACYHVLKRVNNDIRTDETIRDRVNRYRADEAPYIGDTEVLHYLEVLRDEVGFAELSKKVVKPLTGRKIGAYYGRAGRLRPAERVLRRLCDRGEPRLRQDPCGVDSGQRRQPGSRVPHHRLPLVYV